MDFPSGLDTHPDNMPLQRLEQLGQIGDHNARLLDLNAQLQRESRRCRRDDGGERSHQDEELARAGGDVAFADARAQDTVACL